MKESEGLRLEAYRDSGGKLTIGYGHTAGVKVGDVLTAAEAEALLVEDLNAARAKVDTLKLQLTQGQRDALTDFVFNIGFERLRKSTLLKLIRQKATSADIQYQFRRWVYCGGIKLSGLVKRRNWEAERWAD